MPCILLLQCACLDPDNLEENAANDAPKGVCSNAVYKGDDYCDDGNNNAGCAWDGGDCCAATTPYGVLETNYCTEVGRL